MIKLLARTTRYLTRSAAGVALAICTFGSAHALEGDALQQSCAIRAALVKDGGSGVLDTIVNYFSWNTTVPADRIRAGLAALEQLNFTEAQVFKGISVQTYYQTAIIAAALPTNSPVFIELRFEQIGDTVRMTNVNFKDDLKKLYPDIQLNVALVAAQC